MRLIDHLPGSGNSILRSIRPGRISAGSKDSILLVAITTLTSPLKNNIYMIKTMVLGTVYLLIIYGENPRKCISRN